MHFLSLNILNKLGEKSAPCWSLLRKYIMMQGPQNGKEENVSKVPYLPKQFMFNFVLESKPKRF